MRLIVGISGASGVILGYKLLEALRQHPHVEVHLVITESGVLNFKQETDVAIEDVVRLADFHYDNCNMGALISSGSFVADGMIVVPCSMKTLSGIANGFADNLIIRAADVCLKEGRRVVLVPRETPLSAIHIRNLKLAVEGGCSIVPPMLTFYSRNDTLEAQIQHIIGKILMQFGIEHKEFVPWRGI